MNYSGTLRELKSLGTAQNRKVYRRHGIGEKMYAVSFANLNMLQKKIKTDHDLAQKLWSSGNHDARVLAAMIADPQQATIRLLDAWKTSTITSLPMRSRTMPGKRDSPAAEWSNGPGRNRSGSAEPAGCFWPEPP